MDSTFRSMRSRNFRLFAGGQLISKVGMWMQTVAVALLVLDITDSGVAVGLVTATQYLPVLLLSAWAGLWSDRRDRHRLLLGLNAFGAVVAAAFAVVVLGGHMQLWLVFPLVLLSGAFTALENPVRRVFVADLVVDADVANAVGLNSTLTTVSRVIGPAVAGALIAGPGIGWCFAANAISFGPQIAMFARMDRSQFRVVERVARGRGQLREGLRYAWSDPGLRLPILLVTAVGTLAFNFSVVLPLFATRDLDGGPVTYTLLYSFMSAGSVVGGLTLARRVETDTRYLARATAALGLSMLLLAGAPNVLSAFVLVVPVGMASVVVIAGSNAILQVRASPAMRGRVLAMLSVVIIGSTAIGGPISGAVAEAASARSALFMGAATSLLAALFTSRALAKLDVPGPSADRHLPTIDTSITSQGG